MDVWVKTGVPADQIQWQFTGDVHLGTCICRDGEMCWWRDVKELDTMADNELCCALWHRDLEPSEGHPVLSLSFSPSGDAVLVVTGAAQAKIYDRNGLGLGEFVRGDMYIRDMKNTKGHISGLCAGQWHPTDKLTAMTCSEDGTIRLWDTMELVQKTVIKPKLRKPGRVAVTACTYSHDGNVIAAGLRDGSIHIWNVSGKLGVSAAVPTVSG